MAAVQFNTVQVIRIALLGVIAVLVCFSFVATWGSSMPTLQETRGFDMSFQDNLNSQKQPQDDHFGEEVHHNFKDEADDAVADDIADDGATDDVAEDDVADDTSNRQKLNAVAQPPAVVKQLEKRKAPPPPQPPAVIAPLVKATTIKPKDNGRSKHDFNSVQDVFDSVKNNPVLADIVFLGDQPKLNVFKDFDTNKTERIWFYCHDPNYLRCFTRNDHDHVILDLCIPVHSWRQQWMFTSDGQVGTFYKGLGEYCLTADFLNLVVVAPCIAKVDKTQQWRFESGRGLIHAATGYCVVANEGYSQVNLAPCNSSSVQWFMKFTNDLQPHPEDWKIWSDKFNEWRQKAVEANKPYVQDAARRSLEQIQTPIKHLVDRRVVVFYQPPKYEAILTQIRWWLLAYKKLGLDEPGQRFDVLIYGHMGMLDNLTRDYGCEKKDLDPNMSPPAEESRGVCWLIPFEGASEREPKAYDGWFNSIEVLVNKATRTFLSKWRLILRSDADTFPTPNMRDYWVDQVFMGRNAGYNNRYSQAMLKNSAEEGGLKYKGVMNIASSYYGPSDSVLRIADLTVAAGRYLRVHLFSDATGCKLAPFLRPKGLKCEWGSGLWEGVMLLYSQEVAVNHLLSIGDDIQFFPAGMMDIITTGRADVCKFKMLHVYHSDDRFSKHHFIVGNYKNLDMAEYDLRTSNDYSTWFALTANDQGLNGDKPLLRIGGDFKTLCNN